MTDDDLRRLALALPEAVEGAHMGHADFRVRGKIFASLPAPGRGVAKLTPDQQEVMVGAEPGVFGPAAGHWGRMGWTELQLAAADEATVRSALLAAWRNVAPKRLRAVFDAALSR